MMQNRQGGSVVGFILGSLLLAFLLFGGVYFVHRQSQAPVSVPRPGQGTSQPAGSPPKPAPEQKKQEPHPPEPAPAAPQPSSSPAQFPSNGATSQQLPRTGPHNTLVSAFAIFLLSGTLFSYLRSRRSSSL